MKDNIIIKSIEKAIGYKFEQVKEGRKGNWSSLNIFEYTKNSKGEINSLVANGLSLMSVSDATWMLLEELKGLRSLTLVGNRLHDISFVRNLTNLTHLNLNHNEIGEISSLDSLVKLKELSLRDNKISELAFLSECKQIEFLTLSNNKIESVVPLGNLIKLKSLHLAANEIKNISALKSLKNMTDLELSYNKLDNIDGLKYLVNLKHLYMHETGVRDLAPLKTLAKLTGFYAVSNNFEDLAFLGECKSLTELYLRDNHIVDISPLGGLGKLEQLNIAENKISNIDAIRNLDNLIYLAVESNKIKVIPSWLLDFNLPIVWEMKRDHSYNCIVIGENPIESPPIDIVKQGNQGLSNYFKQIKKEKTSFLYEAKLIIIGEGGTGKTSFAYKLQDENAVMPKEDDSTFGIKVYEWVYPIETKATKPDDNILFMNVNIWDFGGQKIYKGTHQIFFSEKTLYVLLDDNREEKTDFSYWLNTVEQLAGSDSPLVIVINLKHNRTKFEFDEIGYRGQFAKIVRDVVKLDLKLDKEKIIVLQQIIKVRLQELPLIGSPLPASWVNIRESLSKETNNYISFDRFREICKSHAVNDPSIIRTLSYYYTSIGAFTHYIEDNILQDRIYLNSNWLLNTVYKILDNSEIASKNGRLDEKDVKKIWQMEGLHFEIEKLTSLMNKFGLMYHIPGTKEYVVPEHLSTQTPYAKWPFEEAHNILQFIFEFDKYMPKGLMSKLIVSLNNYIKNHNLVWQKGVNIELNATHAEIIETYGGRNSFHIRLVGEDKRGLLAIIIDKFEDILKPFKNIKIEKLVPCNCIECVTTSTPHFYKYSDLIRRLEKSVSHVECENSYAKRSIKQLLEGIQLVSSTDEKNGVIRAVKKEMKNISFFLASSFELKHDREQVELWIGRENKRLSASQVFIHLNIWEDFLDSMSNTRLQDEYNLKVRSSDVFLGLFGTKVGKYTEEEFDMAYNSFKDSGKPKYIYTFFKESIVSTSNINMKDLRSLGKFKTKIKKLGHFPTSYKSDDDLIKQLKIQLDKILKDIV